jgi:hypothetical protein
MAWHYGGPAPAAIDISQLGGSLSRKPMNPRRYWVYEFLTPRRKDAKKFL